MKAHAEKDRVIFVGLENRVSGLHTASGEHVARLDFLEGRVEVLETSPPAPSFVSPPVPMQNPPPTAMEWALKGLEQDVGALKKRMVPVETGVESLGRAHNELQTLVDAVPTEIPPASDLAPIGDRISFMEGSLKSLS